MTHIVPLLAVILTSSLLRGAAADPASILCPWTKVLPSKEVHYSFLRGDPRPGSPSLRLYHSAWSGQPRAPLSCAWSDDAAVIQNYLSLCRERTDEFSDRPDASLDVESMLGAEGLCMSVGDTGAGGRTGKRSARSVGEEHQGAERSEVRNHQRVKRGFIVPGTLWCGSGNKAPSYADLGVFADTDSCCREHDQCKHTILSFHSQFGVFNSNIFTMSHCDCDNKFRRCLMEANDSISDVVGYTFFNLLKMHCFQFSHRLQCSQRNWFGMCKETKMALYAEVHPPTQYESPNPTDVSLNSSILSSTLPTELLRSNTSISAAASTVPTPSTSSSGSNGTRSAGSAPESRDDLENTLLVQTHTELQVLEKRLSCSVYKDLDQCRDKILPQQKKYGLYNPEAATLYHCNCTNRLFQTLAKQRQLTEVQALLLGHVSRSCFLPQDCSAGKTCSAAVLSADVPELDQSSRAGVEEQRHLQAIRMKVRRPNIRRAKRKDRPARLHKLCLRMVRSRLNQNQNRTHSQDSAVRGRE